MSSGASWVVSESGEPISGCCVQATARDFALFGHFILDGGRIDGRSVLPEGYLDQATQTQIRTDRIAGFDYGFQWWTRDDGSFAAIGIFGQYIFVDPARRLVIAGNSSWQDARGRVANQNAERGAFFTAIQAAIDSEG
jgi:CubicO group peptidase (beta-lactamase class C family)